MKKPSPTAKTVGATAGPLAAAWLLLF